MTKFRVLYLDKDDDQIHLTIKSLKTIDPELHFLYVTNPFEALRLIDKQHFDCIMSEYFIPEMNGIQLFKEIKKKSNLPFLLYTSIVSEEVADEIFEAGISDYLIKEKELSHFQGLAKHIRTMVEKNRVSQLHQMEEELRLKSMLLDESIDSVILHSLDGKIIYANKAAANIRGYKVEELQEMNIEKLVMLDHRIRTRVIIENIPPGGLVFETVNLTKNGDPIYFEVKSIPIKIDEQTYILCVSRDISERKEYERKLALLHQHASELHKTETLEEVSTITLRIVMESLGYTIGAFGVVEDGYLDFIKIHGLNIWKPFKLPLNGPGISVRCVRTGKSQFVINTSIDKDYLTGPNQEFNQLSEIDVPVIVDGEVKAVIHVSSLKPNHFTRDDLSLLEVFADHVSLSLYRIIRRQRLEDVTKAQSHKVLDGATRVTSMVRHDLRSPLQSIRNASHMIRRSPERTERMLEIIDNSVAYATKILEDLRFIVEPGTLRRENIDVIDLLQERLFSAIIPGNVKIETCFPSTLTALMDPTMMSRVMDNLIRNAVEAMPDGGILTIKADTEDGELTISVKDTGIGIPADVVGRLFEPFQTTKSSGTGLGLYYAKQAVEAHGGTIGVETKEGVGTEFRIRIPTS